MTEITGVLLPPGTLPRVDIGEPASITLQVENVITMQQIENEAGEPDEVPLDKPLVRVIYPDGFVRHHEAADFAELLPKISSFLTGRYGIASFTVSETPAEFTAGNIVLGDVTYDG